MAQGLLKGRRSKGRNPRRSYLVVVVCLLGLLAAGLVGVADHLQVVAGEPLAEGLHVAGDSGLTHTQQLAVIVELSRLPVPEQLKEQVPASLFPSGRFGSAVFDDLFAE